MQAGRRFWSAVGMDPRTVLALFDEQLRRHPRAEPGEHIEAGERVTRRVAAADGWTGVSWSDLDEASAGPVIDAQIRRFAALGQPWEWKYYSYDQPADLPERLRAAGFTPAEPEALLIAETDALALAAAPASSSAPGVTLADITGPSGADELVRVHDEVFGGSHAAIGRAVLAGLDREPPDVVGVVARAGGAPVAAARVDFPAGADFAGLWGGGTLPGWRGRGIFRALVAHRAALAAARGYRYLQVDALPASAPILQRLGFVRLATTVPFSFSYPGTGSWAAARAGPAAQPGPAAPGRTVIPAAAAGCGSRRRRRRWPRRRPGARRAPRRRRSCAGALGGRSARSSPRAG